MKERGEKFKTFRLVWAGQLLSRLGSGVSSFALGLHLYRQSGSATTYSLLLICSFLPGLLLMPLGGVLADRFSRRLQMILSDLGAALGVGFTLLMLRMGAPQWSLYLAVAGTSIFSALHSPAFKAAVTDMVEEADYSRAGGLVQLAEAARHVISPVVAGLLLTVTSLAVIMFLDVLTFLCAAGCAAFATFEQNRDSKEENSKLLVKDLMLGIDQIRKTPAMANLLRLAFFTTFFAGVLQTLFAPLVLRYADEKTLGMVLSTSALGMIVSCLFIGSLKNGYEQKTALGKALLAAALSCILIGFSRRSGSVTVAAFLFFACLPFINTALEVLIRKETAGEIQGRIWSAVSVISQTGMLLAFALSGVASDMANKLFAQIDSPSQVFGNSIGPTAPAGPAIVISLTGVLFLLVAVHFRLSVTDPYRTEKIRGNLKTEG